MYVRPKKKQRSSHRSGWTALEVMVTISIIALIIALVFPAIQRARETSRKTTCRNNLRQLGVAAHNLEAVTQTFPDPEYHFYSLLPYLEQSKLYEWIKDGHNSRKMSMSDVEAVVPTFLCPSDVYLHTDGATQTSYNLNSGTVMWQWSLNGLAKAPRKNDYVSRAAAVTAQDITDGMSNTAMYSERLAVPELNHVQRLNEVNEFAGRRPKRFLWYTDQDFIFDNGVRLAQTCQIQKNRVSTGGYLNPGNAFGQYRATYTHITNPNTFGCMKAKFQTHGMAESTRIANGVYPSTSDHDGGVNTLMADGSVRFFADRIDNSIWQAIGTRNGSEQFNF